MHASTELCPSPAVSNQLFLPPQLLLGKAGRQTPNRRRYRQTTLVSCTRNVVTSGASVAVTLLRALVYKDGSGEEKMLVGKGVKSQFIFYVLCGFGGVSLPL